MTREQLQDDALTEFLADLYHRRMVAAADEAEKRRWQTLMVACVNRRSPERVAEMERQRGLRGGSR